MNFAHLRFVDAAARSSKSTAHSPLPNAVELALEITGGSDLLARPHSSDSTLGRPTHLIPLYQDQKIVSL